MLFRKPLPLWIVFGLFVVSAAAMPLAFRLLRRPTVPPRTLSELTERLSQVEPTLYVVPMPNGPADGVWVCVRPLTWEQLEAMKLRRVPEYVEYAQQWQGIVLCQGLGKSHMMIPHEELEDWGEYGLRCPAPVAGPSR